MPAMYPEGEKVAAETLSVLLDEVRSPELDEHRWKASWEEAKPLIDRTGHFMSSEAWAEVGVARGWMPIDGDLP